MANEISVSVALSGYKSTSMSGYAARQVLNSLQTMVNNVYAEGTISVTTSETTIPLVGITVGVGTGPRWSFFQNLDPTNFIKLYSLTGQAAKTLIYLHPGDCCLFPMWDAATPFAIAVGGTCLLDYLIFSF